MTELQKKRGRKPKAPHLKKNVRKSITMTHDTEKKLEILVKSKIVFPEEISVSQYISHLISQDYAEKIEKKGE